MAKHKKIKEKPHRIAIDLIKRFEGLADGDNRTLGLEPYLDPVGIPTMGYGSTRDLDGHRVTLQTPAITHKQAGELLTREAEAAEAAVERLISVKLSHNQRAALVSFTYNLGEGSLSRSTLRKKLNNGDYAGAAKEILRWTKASGRTLRGLVRRREAEMTLFLQEDEPEDKKPTVAQGDKAVQPVLL